MLALVLTLLSGVIASAAVVFGTAAAVVLGAAAAVVLAATAVPFVLLSSWSPAAPVRLKLLLLLLLLLLSPSRSAAEEFPKDAFRPACSPVVWNQQWLPATPSHCSREAQRDNYQPGSAATSSNDAISSINFANRICSGVSRVSRRYSSSSTVAHPSHFLCRMAHASKYEVKRGSENLIDGIERLYLLCESMLLFFGQVGAGGQDVGLKTRCLGWFFAETR